jgi:hypothetical protein
LKYSPDQPRAPSGSSDGGQWVDGGGGSAGGSGGGSDSQLDGGLDATPAGVLPIGPQPPSDPAGNGPNDPPKIPGERPSSGKERNVAVKAVARWLKKYGKYGGTLGKVAEGLAWIYEYSGYITSYLDEAKTLEELQNLVASPETGYDIHHIVEQTPAEKEGFSRDQIDGPTNLVRIPTLKHWEINGWYRRKSVQFGDQSPRDYLRNKDWSERTRIGHQALIDHGVLKK